MQKYNPHHQVLLISKNNITFPDISFKLRSIRNQACPL